MDDARKAFTEFWDKYNICDNPLEDEIIAGLNKCVEDTNPVSVSDPVPSPETELLMLRRQVIGLRCGLSEDMASRLHGETEEEIRKDAEELAKLIRETKEPRHDAPLGNPDNIPPADVETVRRRIASKTFGEKIEEALNRGGEWNSLDI